MRKISFLKKNKTRTYSFFGSINPNFRPLIGYLMQIIQKTADRIRIITRKKLRVFIGVGLFLICLLYIPSVLRKKVHFNSNNNSASAAAAPIDSAKAAPSLILDTALYEQKLIKITNGDSSGRWPVKTAYPSVGAILPFKRIVAYYG